jgi:thioesterase domain-containing protein
MAQQLVAAGETVAVVAMIDSFMPGDLAYLHSRPGITEYLDWHLGELLLLPKLARIQYVLRWLANGGIRFKRSVGLEERSSLARATRRIAAAHQRAVLRYKPKPYSGKVVQLMCSDASHRCYEDRRLAWSTVISGEFEVQVVPGNHLTMVEDPHACVLARELQLRLDRANNSELKTLRRGEFKRQPVELTSPERSSGNKHKPQFSRVTPLSV